ncbi:MAG: hypothetical protein KAV87_11280 [Desulfobacteraceae bacterium]|nr:hypothetical protein [Desulfobacteraceae bacterium]
MVNSKTGVIIQGPLITFGQGSNRSPKGFSTYQTIRDNVERIKSLGLEHVICTWQPVSNTETQIADKLQNNGLNVLILDTPKLADPDHRYKHHFAIKAGFDHLRNQDAIEFVIKIRTDMLIPKEIFLWLLDQMRNCPDKLIVSELYDDGNIGDFIYSGSAKILDEFLSSVLKHGNFNIHPSIGTDIGLKFLAHKTKTTLNPLHLPMGIYYMFFLMRRNKHFSRWCHFVYENLLILPEKLWKDIIWRDKKMADVMSGPYLLFCEHLTNKRIEAKQLNFKQTLARYRFAMSGYYMKRINKNLRAKLKGLKRNTCRKSNHT